MKSKSKAFRSNVRLARKTWGAKISTLAISVLEPLVDFYSLSIATGDLLYLNRCWYVTCPGLLRLARRNRCAGIHVEPVQMFSDPSIGRWAFKATVYKSRTCKGFVGYGDADPSNVSPLVHGAEMRVAETRAVNRALRKAYGIGLCSVEELGWPSRDLRPSRESGEERASVKQNGSGNGQPRLRDRLCLIIRQHQLDPALVKLYAADYCGM